MPAAIWSALIGDAVTEDHPQFRFADLCADLDVAPSDVGRWTDIDPEPERRRLISMALRPAPVTDGWLKNGPELGDLTLATAGLSLLDAPDPRLEALSIAVRLRAAVEAGQKAALVTPDRTLTRQVTAALDRWGIEPDDSAGRPLALSAPGRLLRHVANGIGRHPTPEDLLTILKHPLVHTGADRGSHLRYTHELELWLRRDGPPHLTLHDLRRWADTSRLKNVASWINWIASTILSLPTLSEPLLADLVDAHLKVTQNLASGSSVTGSGLLWEKKPGQAAFESMSALRSQADVGGAMSVSDYRALIDAVLSEEVRDPVLPHPNVMIWGTLEARVQGADLVILGGLNEGAWPEPVKPDPWLNRRMRADLGLLLPERRIGLSAHDFQQAVCAPEVMITRARARCRGGNGHVPLAQPPDKPDERSAGQRWARSAVGDARPRRHVASTGPCDGESDQAGAPRRPACPLPACRQSIDAAKCDRDPEADPRPLCGLRAPAFGPETARPVAQGSRRRVPRIAVSSDLRSIREGGGGSVTPGCTGALHGCRPHRAGRERAMGRHANSLVGTA